MKKRIVAAAALALASTIVQAAGTPTYNLTAIGDGSGWRINEAGQVAGWSNIANKAYLYTPGVGRTLIDPAPFATSSLAYGINNAGEVVGYSQFSGGGGSQPFKFSLADGLQPLTRPTTTSPFLPYLRGVSINDHGSVAGDQWYSTAETGPQMNPSGVNVIDVNNSNLFAGSTVNFATGYRTAALWSPTTGLQSVGGIGGNTSTFMALNDSGWAVGYGENQWFVEHAMLYDGSTLIDIGAQFGARTFSQAYGVSESGLVVGRFTPGGQYGNGPVHAFAYSSEYGAFDLNGALAAGQGDGWVLLSAQDATADGRIVGWGSLNGTISAFVLTPVSAVPEASTVVQATLGLAMVMGCALRRGKRRDSKSGN